MVADHKTAKKHIANAIIILYFCDRYLCQASHKDETDIHYRNLTTETDTI